MPIDRCTLTVLCENTAGQALGLLGEHGWAVLVETDLCTLLFDTGNRTILHNAGVLGKDLSHLDCIALSHGHYDHAGGLADVLAVTGPIDVLAHPDVFQDRYSVRGDSKREIGIHHKKTYLESLGARFRASAEFSEVVDHIYLTGEIPRVTPFETPDPQLRVAGPMDSTLQDALSDDQALVLDTRDGLVVVLGCAHAGIINTLIHVTEHLPGRPLHVVLGGTHLGFADEEQFQATSYLLAGYEIEHFGTGHCTGMVNGARLRDRFGDTVFYAAAGTRVDVPFALS